MTSRTTSTSRTSAAVSLFVCTDACDVCSRCGDLPLAPPPPARTAACAAACRSMCRSLGSPLALPVQFRAARPLPHPQLTSVSASRDCQGASAPRALHTAPRLLSPCALPCPALPIHTGAACATLRQGDTLAGIASMYGVHWLEIFAINPLTRGDPDAIRPGTPLPACACACMCLQPLVLPRGLEVPMEWAQRRTCPDRRQEKWEEARG